MDYLFFNDLFLRSPFYSYELYTPDKIDKILKDTAFRCALYLASPALYDSIANRAFELKSLSKKELLSINRYYNRMTYRPTPFGSFSSFTTVNWGEGSNIQLVDERQSQLHLSFDQEIAIGIAEKLVTLNIDKQAFKANPTLYEVGKDFRFIKSSFSDEKGKVEYDLESIEKSLLTKALFTFMDKPQKSIDIISFMINLTGCTAGTAQEYLTFLISARLVISSTGINIIGEDYLERIETSLLFSPNQAINDLKKELHTFQFPEVDQLEKLENKVKDKLDESNLKQPKQVFYSGLERKADHGNLAIKYQAEILNGLEAMSMLTLTEQPSNLKNFILEFKNKYDKRKIPLLEAIDPDIGIAYGLPIDAAAESDLLKDVKFGYQKNNITTIEWSAAHQLLFKKWNTQSTEPILLTKADLEGLPGTEALPAPPTLSVIFRTAEDGIFLESAGGATAAALIGRFTLWSDDVYLAASLIAQKEQETNPNVIFAELGQLSDAHTDNINRRKHCYDYEIPINSISILSQERQIELSDLLISVTGNELVLESKRLKKTIIPRLTSAFNYRHNNLSIFKLLCDLQYQGLRSNYTFSLERFFPGLAYYPRVTFERTILCPAIWHLSENQMNRLKKTSGKIAFAEFKLLQEQLGLPAYIALSRFDQQLVFRTEVEEDILFLVECLKESKTATIQEFYLPREATVQTIDNRTMINQFVAFLYRKQQVIPGYAFIESIDSHKIKSEYVLGSKWLYLKLYCNPSMSNDILYKKLLPVLRQFNEAAMLSWFFIRYRDTGYHIRLRLKINEAEVGTILRKLKIRLAGTINYHLIKEYQADTYRRELERYGTDMILQIEQFFHGSSELILNYIKASSLKSFPFTYHSLAFVSIFQLLNAVLPAAEEQIDFLERMVNAFYSEFSSDKCLKVDLDQKYREVKNEMQFLLSEPGYYSRLRLKTSADLYLETIKLNADKMGEFTVKRKQQLLADMIHMHLNRLFVDKQRNQELIVYYCLLKYVLSKRAINRKRF